MMNLTLFKNFPITSYANQLYVNSEKERNNMFNSWESDFFNELSSCDKTKKTIRLDINYYHGNMYNYGILHENNKDYYVFITDTEWLSNRTVVLHYEYDYFQTYVYQMDFKKSMIEREHVSDDTFGKWMNDEGLDTGERLVQSVTNLNGGSSDRVFCMSIRDTRDVLSTGSNEKKALPQLTTFNTYERSATIVAMSDASDLSWILNKVANANRLNAVSGLYTVPSSTLALYNKVACYDWDTGDKVGYYLTTGKSTAFVNTTVKPTNIDGYTPKNNKCFLYPYCYVNFSNSNGQSLTGRFEYSNDKSNVQCAYRMFAIEGVPSYLWLQNYNGFEKNLDNTITTDDHVQIPWTADSYATYVSGQKFSMSNTRRQKQIDYVYDTGKGAISSMLSGNFLGVATSITDNTKDLYSWENSLKATLNDVKNTPPSMEGTFSSSANNLIGDIGFKAELITLSAENIRTIDDYFSMFGYKTSHIVSLSSVMNTRSNWNYVKSVGANITGRCPYDAINTVKSMFNSGTTLWHDLTTMYNYDLPNTIK